MAYEKNIQTRSIKVSSRPVKHNIYFSKTQDPRKNKTILYDTEQMIFV